MRALSAVARTHIHEELAHRLGDELIEFVEAVVLVVAHPLGRAGGLGTAAELTTIDRVIALLERSLAGEPTAAEAAGDLAGDPEMLAAFFQNLDLLPRGGHPAADAVTLLVLLALGRLES